MVSVQARLSLRKTWSNWSEVLHWAAGGHIPDLVTEVHAQQTGLPAIGGCPKKFTSDELKDFRLKIKFHWINQISH